jgi:hypothetical protein
MIELTCVILTSIMLYVLSYVWHGEPTPLGPGGMTVLTLCLLMAWLGVFVRHWLAPGPELDRRIAEMTRDQRQREAEADRDRRAIVGLTGIRYPRGPDNKERSFWDRDKPETPALADAGQKKDRRGKKGRPRR